MNQIAPIAPYVRPGDHQASGFSSLRRLMIFAITAIGLLLGGACFAASLRPTRSDANGDPEPAEEDERDQNVRHNLAISGGSLALLSAGVAAGPLTVLPGLGLLTYSTVRRLRRAWRHIRDEGKLGSPVLDATALVGTIVLGYWILAAGLAAIASAADWLARRTERQSRLDLAVLFDVRTRSAWLKNDEILIEVPCDRLRVGDVIVVEAGMTLPVDGRVHAGVGRIDQQSLTGEATPVEVDPGAQVLAATILLEGRLEIELERSGSESVAAELVELLSGVDRARDDGLTRAERTIDRWVPTTLVASGIGVFLAGPVVGVAVVFSGIGYALRYAGPTALLNHMRIAMKRGVLVRDGRALERLDEVDTVVFDKTGTLTLDTPRVTRVRPIAPWTEAEILNLAAAAEAHQVHPIARAIRYAAGADPSFGPTRSTVKPGLGLDVVVDDRRVLIGSERLLAAEGVSLSVPAVAASTDGILIHIAIDGRHAATIELEACLREEAPAVIESLQASGIQVMVLSGDREQVTRELSERLGLDGYFAEVLPKQKAEIVAELQAKGRKVCFVGDGINDVLALSTANVSVSFAGAAPIAESAASVVLMRPDLELLPSLMTLASDNTRNFERSSMISTVSGFVCMGGVLGFGMGLAQAMTLYNASVVACMANASLPLLDAPGSEDPAPKDIDP